MKPRVTAAGSCCRKLLQRLARRSRAARAATVAATAILADAVWSTPCVVAAGCPATRGRGDPFSAAGSMKVTTFGPQGRQQGCLPSFAAAPSRSEPHFITKKVESAQTKMFAQVRWPCDADRGSTRH